MKVRDLRLALEGVADDVDVIIPFEMESGRGCINFAVAENTEAYMCANFTYDTEEDGEVSLGSCFVIFGEAERYNYD